MSSRYQPKMLIGFFLIIVAVLFACSKGGEKVSSNKGIGPVKSVTLGAIDSERAAQGQQIFKTKCSACHKLEEKYVGPALKGVTQRRTPEWIMNMILNPQEMTQKDPIAQELLATYYTQMTFQNVTEDEVRSILEYFRQVDSEGAQIPSGTQP